MLNKSIDGRTKIFGLIGKHIEGSLSPVIHNTLNDNVNINSKYLCFNVDNDLEFAIKGASALNICGFNITAPYKQEVIQYLVGISDEANWLQSVNTIVYDNDKKGYVGYNTDYFGFKEMLIQNDVLIENQKVLVLGAGGSSYAICKVLEDMKAGTLHIANRTLQNAEILAKKLNLNNISYIKLDNIDDEYDLIIQTTTVGFANDINKSPIDLNKINKCKCAIDIIYNPKETLFLKECKSKGIRTLNGIDMLYYQGVKAYEIFNNIKLNEDLIKNIKKEFEILLNEK